MTDLPGLDAAAVAAWMTSHVPGITGPLTFRLIAGGHSNLTYGADDAAGNRCVVRRGPLGGSGGRAHDMGREHRIISALAPTGVPVPRALALCEDDSVNGAPFYVMTRVEGAVLDNVAAADAHLPDPGARRHAGEQVIDVLATMHRVDVDAVGLAGAGAGTGAEFVSRQLHRFAQLWDRNRTRDIAAMTTLPARLERVAPTQRYTGIVHGDYRIGNVMIDAHGSVAAVLDWELWTLGDVLADLGFVLNNWYEPDDPTPLVFMEMPPTVSGGFGSRAGALERYAEQTGYDVSAIDYYRAFQHWRMAVLAEGVKRRYESAQMANADVDFDHLDQRVLRLAELAAHHLAAYERAT